MTLSERPAATCRVVRNVVSPPACEVLNVAKTERVTLRNYCLRETTSLTASFALAFRASDDELVLGGSFPLTATVDLAPLPRDKLPGSVRATLPV